MLINFETPVLPIDSYAQRAFVEILNIIILSADIEELSRRLRTRNYDQEYRRLTGYFKWSYAGNDFNLWQRIEYDSPHCFKNKVLEVKQYVFVTQNRILPELQTH